MTSQDDAWRKCSDDALTAARAVQAAVERLTAEALKRDEQRTHDLEKALGAAQKAAAEAIAEADAAKNDAQTAASNGISIAFEREKKAVAAAEEAKAAERAVSARERTLEQKYAALEAQLRDLKRQLKQEKDKCNLLEADQGKWMNLAMKSQEVASAMHEMISSSKAKRAPAQGSTSGASRAGTGSAPDVPRTSQEHFAASQRRVEHLEASLREEQALSQDAEFGAMGAQEQEEEAGAVAGAQHEVVAVQAAGDVEAVALEVVVENLELDAQSVNASYKDPSVAQGAHGDEVIDGVEEGKEKQTEVGENGANEVEGENVCGGQGQGVPIGVTQDEEAMMGPPVFGATGLTVSPVSAKKRTRDMSGLLHDSHMGPGRSLSNSLVRGGGEGEGGDTSISTKRRHTRDEGIQALEPQEDALAKQTADEFLRRLHRLAGSPSLGRSAPDSVPLGVEELVRTHAHVEAGMGAEEDEDMGVIAADAMLGDDMLRVTAQAPVYPVEVAAVVDGAVCDALAHVLSQSQEAGLHSNDRPQLTQASQDGCLSPTQKNGTDRQVPLHDPAVGKPAILFSWEPHCWSPSDCTRSFSFDAVGHAAALPDCARVLGLSEGSRVVGRSSELLMLSATVSRKQAIFDTTVLPGPTGYAAPAAAILARVRTVVRNMGVNPMYVWRKGVRDPIQAVLGKSADSENADSLELHHGDVLAFLMCAYNKESKRPIDEVVTGGKAEDGSAQGMTAVAGVSSSTGVEGPERAPQPWSSVYLRGPYAHLSDWSESDASSWTSPHTLRGIPLDQAPRVGYIWVYRVNEAAVRAGAFEGAEGQGTRAGEHTSLSGPDRRDSSGTALIAGSKAGARG